MTEIHDLVAAYALDALDSTESALFERHLDSCEQCVSDLINLQESTVRLAEETEAAPPPALKQSVMSAVVKEARRPSKVTSMTGRLRRYQIAAVGLGAMAAVLIVVMAIGLEGDGIDARFTYSFSEGAGVFVTDSLPDVTPARTYELWLIDGDGPSPAGLFVPGSDGLADVLVENVAAGQSIGVTVEPAGGSETPTGEVILIGGL
jgi:anti-sigma-K factor RskA